MAALAGLLVVGMFAEPSVAARPVCVHAAGAGVAGVRLGLRRPDGSMPGAPVLATAATVGLGVLRSGSASLDVVPGPGAAVTWTVTIRPAG